MVRDEVTVVFLFLISIRQRGIGIYGFFLIRQIRQMAKINLYQIRHNLSINT